MNDQVLRPAFEWRLRKATDQALSLQTSPDDEILRLARACAPGCDRNYENEHAPEETKKEQRPTLDSRRIFRTSV
jgi:hypothetical protein